MLPHLCVGVLALTASAGVAVAQAAPQGERIVLEAPHQPPAAQISSRIIFLHRCPTGGCVINAGDDDSRTDTSALVDSSVTLTGFQQSNEVWDRMVTCVKETFAPFDVEVTDVDPGNVPHFENIVGGLSSQLRDDIPNAIGVAVKTCTELPNAVTFTFDAVGPDPDSLCWTASQEIAHGFGLEHEYNLRDPLTYLGGGPSMKRFQATDSACGTYNSVPCSCGRGPTQNSYAYLLDLFGPGAVTPPTVAIKLPKAGKQVTPGFRITASAIDDVGIDHVELWIDGVQTASVATEAPYLLTAPLDLAEGMHTVEVIAHDVQMQTATATLEVDVGPPCSSDHSCPSGDACVMSVCVAGPGTPGGLGSECGRNLECLSNSCATDASGEQQCVEVCDPGLATSCPSDFECRDTGNGAGVCWSTGSGGCCDAGSHPAGPMLLGLGVLAVLVSRKRRG